MVLINLFAGWNSDTGIENRFWTQQGGERVGQSEEVTLKHIHRHM